MLPNNQAPNSGCQLDGVGVVAICETSDLPGSEA